MSLRMKTLIFAMFLQYICMRVNAQPDTIEFHNYAIVVGYIKSTSTVLYEDPTVEIAETKKSKETKHYRRSDVFEYARNGKRFHILRDFKPFGSSDLYFDEVEAKVFQKGNISILGIDNKHHTITTYMGGGLLGTLLDLSLGNQPYIYVLYDATGKLAMGVPSKKEKFKAMMLEFFSQKVIDDYEKEFGELKFNDLTEFVTHINAKEKGKVKN
jgi:hypothetical protein